MRYVVQYEESHVCATSKNNSGKRREKKFRGNEQCHQTILRAHNDTDGNGKTAKQFTVLFNHILNK